MFPITNTPALPSTHPLSHPCPPSHTLAHAHACSVLRSKGFMWMSNSHSTAYYWSHAGQHFEIRDEGDWWSAVEDADWPKEEPQRKVILQVGGAGAECARGGGGGPVVGSVRGQEYGVGQGGPKVMKQVRAGSIKATLVGCPAPPFTGP